MSLVINEETQLIYIWTADDVQSLTVLDQIKSYGFDTCQPTNIRLIEVSDVRTQQWLQYNEKVIRIDQLPCFLMIDGEQTHLLSVDDKQDVFDYVMATYL